MNSSRLSFAVLLAAMFVTAACGDDPVGPPSATYHVTLTLQQVTGVACAAAGANASGTATVTVNAKETEISVNDLTFSGLSGPVSTAHIQFGITGASGGPAFDFGATLANPLVSPYNAKFTEHEYIAPAGAPALFANFIVSMAQQATYIELHTQACPNGEIRGQLLPDAEVEGQ